MLQHAVARQAGLVLVIITALRGVGAQYCPSGAATACDSVLIVHADPKYVTDVQTTLQSTGAFNKVECFDASTATPTSAQLASYDAVLVYSNRDFWNAEILGDRLATFHDNGGGVVVAMYANSGNLDGNILAGAYGTAANGYALLNYNLGGKSDIADSLGEVLELQSPLMAGVTSFTSSLASRSTAPVITGRAVVVVKWSGGGKEPLVVRGVRGSRTLVELNFFPVSSRTLSNQWTGNGAELLRNALKYSRCKLCQPGTFSVTGEEQHRGKRHVLVWQRGNRRQWSRQWDGAGESDMNSTSHYKNISPTNSR